MSDQDDIFFNMARVASEDPDLNLGKLSKQIELRENDLKITQEKICNLYASTKQLDPKIKTLINSMVSNLSDDTLKNFINKEPYSVNTGLPLESNFQERSNSIAEVNAMIEKLNVGQKAIDCSVEKLDIMTNIEKQRSDLDDTERNLEKLTFALNRLQTNMSKLLTHPSLDEAAQRDLVFEDNLRKVFEKLELFNKYTIAANKIEKACKEANAVAGDDNRAYLKLPPVISSLLQEVESVLLLDDYDSDSQLLLKN